MTDMTSVLSQCLTRGIPIDPMPEMPPKSRDVPHAPIRVPNLNEQVCYCSQRIFVETF